MGTQLGELVQSQEISFDHLLNKTIAVDAMNTMYQFLSIIRQPDGTPLKDSHGQITSHLSGMYYRNAKLRRKGIKPVYIFDGKAPDLKAEESKERRKKREKAREEWKKLKEEGKMKKAFSKATQSSKMTGEMIDEAKKLLDALGIPWIQAPSEGEAQAAYMNNTGDAWAVGSQDWDALLFGGQRLVKNLTTTGRRKIPGKDAYRTIVPEKIETQDALDQLGISLDKLRWVAILIGTDFNPGGIHGIGPQTAMKLVTQYDSFHDLLADDKVEWEHDNDPDAILDFFQHPPVDEDATYSFGQPDRERIIELLVEEHDFSEDRVTSAADKLIDELRESQKDLGSYF